MTLRCSLHHYLTATARARPGHIAIVDPTAGRKITFAALDALSDRLRDRLHGWGIGRGDRVGLYLPKSIDAIAAIFGILKLGAAYVPVDPTAPPSRCAYVFDNCAVRAIITETALADGLHTDFPEQRPRFLTLDRAGDAENGCVQPIPTVQTSADDLAYILYTSGSTGRPKGVMLSHRNAVSFVDWCTEALEPDGSDRFSSHAPFHFDLSILDIYLPIKHGATLYLIGEELSKNPAGMVEMIARNHLTFWYSTPSVLRILMDFGKLADQPDCSLRKIAFAGEVFPVKHLRALQKILPEVRYFNLYGPTETNVCTAFEVVGPIPDERIDPYPIGPVCSHLRARVIDGEGRDVAVGEEGELIISGPGVMQGYWNMADRTAAAFIEDETGRWYRTGDIVIEGDGGVFGYVGRRDRMVKRRGFRIELGEIEAALYRHPEVSEVASIAQSGPDGVVIKAFYSTRNGDTLSLIQLKQFCSRTLPLYMIPDCFSHQQGLPKTSTDKIDYQRLQDFE